MELVDIRDFLWPLMKNIGGPKKISWGIPVGVRFSLPPPVFARVVKLLNTTDLNPVA